MAADTYIRPFEPRSGPRLARCGRAAPFAPPEELDDFAALRRIGQGATGQVSLAEDSVLARRVAIRLIDADPDPAARRRFLGGS